MTGLSDVDRLLGDLIAARAEETGLAAADVVREALLRGLVASPDERVREAETIRAMTPGVLDDSTALIRRMRDGR